ncbi:MAG: DUF2336 domain-containing protein [Alphaproteobacteria bacterium]|nr:DUF2336 domain-containing protein [Alphaproteobacteria bacterium]
MGGQFSIGAGQTGSPLGHDAPAAAPPRGVNADSFRRLTALLKKPVAAPVIPDLQLAPQAAPLAAPPPEVAPAPAALAEASAAPEPAPEVFVPELPALDASALAPPVVELAAEPVLAPAVPAAEPEEPSAPVEELPVAEVEAAAEVEAPAVEVLPEIPPPPAVKEPTPAPATVAPPPLHAASEPAAEPAKPRQAHLRRKPQPDVFAEVPDDRVVPRAAPAAKLTPEQETEKAELARSLLDMMAAGSGQPQERALAADTLLRMLPQLPARMRAMLATRLSIMDAPPPFLISRLIAERDIAIAGPLLEDCAHISDEDLFAIIQTADEAKCRLIARRRKISRPITEALAEHGDVPVLLTLVRNQGAEISHDGFATLAAKAEANPDLLAPMCTRADLPVHFAFELFWAAPAQLRRYLLSRFLTDSENLTKILKITMGSEAVETADEAPALDLEGVGAAIEQVMGPLRDEGIRTLAAAAKVNQSTVERILGDNQGEPLMALLKVVGVPRSALEQALPDMAKGDTPLIDPRRSLDEVQSVFDQLSFNKARILLTYWNWATTRSGPYAPAN